MKRLTLVCLCIITIQVDFNSSYAELQDGGYAGSFLDLGLGVRSLGMGGAFVSVAGDAETGFWNPGGVSFIRARTFSALYRKMSFDRRLTYVTYTQPVRNEAAIGLGWVNAGTGDIQGRDNEGVLNGEVTHSENEIFLTFSKKIPPYSSLGLNIKYVQQKLENISAYGVGFDFGIIFRPPLKRRLTLGVALQNVALQQRWTSGKYWGDFGLQGTSTTDRFPVNLRMGASLEFAQLLIAADVEKRQHQDLQLHLGTEYRYQKLIALRAGFERGVLALGVGLKYSFRSYNLGFNYAYVSSRVEESADQIVSLEVEF